MKTQRLITAGIALMLMSISLTMTSCTEQR